MKKIFYNEILTLWRKLSRTKGERPALITVNLSLASENSFQGLKGLREADDRNDVSHPNLVPGPNNDHIHNKQRISYKIFIIHDTMRSYESIRPFNKNLITCFKPQHEYWCSILPNCEIGVARLQRFTARLLYCQSQFKNIQIQFYYQILQSCYKGRFLVYVIY